MADEKYSKSLMSKETNKSGNAPTTRPSVSACGDIQHPARLFLEEEKACAAPPVYKRGNVGADSSQENRKKKFWMKIYKHTNEKWQWGRACMAIGHNKVHHCFNRRHD
ncbi:hypothetical protein OUZ56_009365 [Daphnia magna]|uniref:Uncharacterized protein n=1 Tax=Daphnia magna TaxID=35525 RepID=A0ABR0AFT2_9CRUS|nr:hypothetical protein OUZ56_009365 [Daphnia magna]